MDNAEVECPACQSFVRSEESGAGFKACDSFLFVSADSFSWSACMFIVSGKGIAGTSKQALVNLIALLFVHHSQDYSRKNAAFARADGKV